MKCCAIDIDDACVVIVLMELSFLITYKCGEMDLCHWGWAFFLLAEILPLTAIFLGVVFFKVKLTAGGVMGSFCLLKCMHI